MSCTDVCFTDPQRRCGLGRNPFEDFHLVAIKAVAVVASEVANAIKEYIVARSKSADRKIVALCSAFTRSNTYSRHITNGIGECTILISMQNKIGHHRHSQRCVRQVLGELPIETAAGSCALISTVSACCSPIVKRLRRALCFCLSSRPPALQRSFYQAPPIGSADIGPY